VIKRTYNMLFEIVQRYVHVVSGFFCLTWHCYKKSDGDDCVYVIKKLNKGTTIKVTTVSGNEVYYDTTDYGYKLYYPNEDVNIRLAVNGNIYVYSGSWVFKRYLRHIYSMAFLAIGLSFGAYLVNKSLISINVLSRLLVK
jgi:hypothetical protein